MKRNTKLRLNNEIIDLFSNLPKSTNTAMSWLLLHKAMEESLNTKENLMKFNLYDFINEYSITYKRTDNIKRDLLRDFKKLKTQVERETINSNGETETETYYFFQKTKINHSTLEVEVKLNEDIFNSITSFPNRNYFQFLKQEAIMIANKKLTPMDLKLLMYFKSQSHNAKESWVKLEVNKLYEILGQSQGTRFADIKKRHIDPFIERTYESTNYVISYEVKKNKINKRTIEAIIFRVDNRKEKIDMIGKELDKESYDQRPDLDDIIQNTMVDEYMYSLKAHESNVQYKINVNKIEKQKQSKKKKEIIVQEVEPKPIIKTKKRKRGQQASFSDILDDFGF